jgi:hypothetical protein
MKVSLKNLRTSQLPLPAGGGFNVGVCYVNQEARSISWLTSSSDTWCSLSDLILFKDSGAIGSDVYENNIGRVRSLALNKLTEYEVSHGDKNIFFSKLREFIATAQVSYNKIAIHVDYSSMPRAIYCDLVFVIEQLLRNQDSATLWYTPGRYPECEYPTAGASDFKVFSGRSSTFSGSRTHIFGLGFDRIRSHGIWSVIDPQCLVSFYADPAADESYVEKVKAENSEIISSSDFLFSAPLNDFLMSFSRITSTVVQFCKYGDVVMVPDGPKPFILACSIIPAYLDRVGVVCFHVAYKNNGKNSLIDVQPAGTSVGFSFDSPAAVLIDE